MSAINLPLSFTVHKDFAPLWKRHPAAAFVFEPTVFALASEITAGQYNGGVWRMVEIDADTFFVEPTIEQQWRVHNFGTQRTFTMSSRVMGVTATLYALNRLAWKWPDGPWTSWFHQLRDAASAMPEACDIFGAID